MPRHQNAHAQVNAGFLYDLDDNDNQTVVSARIIYGGLSGKFVHARHTETYLVGKKLFNDNVLQKALHILNDEIIAEELPAEPSAEFRKKLALSLFYKVRF